MQDLTALEREEAARKAAQEKADLEKWEAQKEAIAEKYRKEVLESPEMQEQFKKEIKELAEKKIREATKKYDQLTHHPPGTVVPHLTQPIYDRIKKEAEHNAELEIKDDALKKYLEEQKEKFLAKQEADREQDRKQQLEQLTPQKLLHNQPPRDLSALHQTEDLVQAEQELQAYKQVRDNQNPRDYLELKQGNDPKQQDLAEQHPRTLEDRLAEMKKQREAKEQEEPEREEPEDEIE